MKALDWPGEELDWQTWRIVTSPKISASLHEIQTEWTLADVERAHLNLDVLDDAETLATPDPPKRS